MMITMNNSRNVLNAVCGAPRYDERVHGVIDVTDSFEDAMDDDSTSSSIDDVTEAIPQLQDTIAMPPPANVPRRPKMPMARILASSSPEITALCKNPYQNPRGQDCDVVSMGSSTSPIGGGSAKSLPTDMDCIMTQMSKLSFHRRLSHAQLPSCEQICCTPAEVEKLTLYKKVSEESSLNLPSLRPSLSFPPPPEDPPQVLE
jgi:hypothetical protein